MFRKLLKNKRAQNTAEYALLISLVVAGVIAMQTYAQRALQGRIRDASKFLSKQSSDLGNTVQYEPYYLTTDYTVRRTDDETIHLDKAFSGKEGHTNRVREVGGFQSQAYCAAIFPELQNGL